MFFSPTDYEKYPPCGMFTIPHLILFVICVSIIVVAVYLTRKINKDNLKKTTKVIAIILVILEMGKTIYNLYYGYTNIDSIVPLHFCSLFIYSTILAGFGKGKLERFGNSFITSAGLVCGGFFLIFPTTSLTMHPAFHFLSIHSMLYHSCMVYLSIMYLIKDVFKPTLLNFKYYLIFCLISYLPALIINGIFHSNLMFLREPYRIPIYLLTIIQQKSEFIYTLIIMLAYLSVYIVPWMVDFIKTKRENKQQQFITN